MVVVVTVASAAATAAAVVAVAACAAEGVVEELSAVAVELSILRSFLWFELRLRLRWLEACFRDDGETSLSPKTRLVYYLSCSCISKDAQKTTQLLVGFLLLECT